MAKYYDKKLFYKRHYHNRSVYNQSTGRVIPDPDHPGRYIIEKVGRTFNNFACLHKNKLHFWHRKRKSKYAVAYYKPNGIYANMSGIWCMFLDIKSVVFNEVYSYYDSEKQKTIYRRPIFLGVIDGVCYYEVMGSAKYKDTSYRYIAKSKDGTLIETLAPVITTASDDVHFIFSNSHKTAVFPEETYNIVDGKIESSTVRYFKLIPQTDSLSIINLSSKIPEGEIITSFTYPFVYTATAEPIRYKFGESGTIREFYTNKKDIATKVYLITENDQLVDITDDLKPTKYTRTSLVYRNSSGTNFIWYPFYELNEECQTALRHLYIYRNCGNDHNRANHKWPGPVSLYNSADILFPIQYNVIIEEFNNLFLEIEKEGIKIFTDISKPFRETYQATYLRTRSFQPLFHYYKINKSGSVLQVRVFESDNKVNKLDMYDFEYVTCDSNYFYFYEYNDIYEEEYGKAIDYHGIIKLNSDMSTYTPNVINDSGLGFTYELCTYLDNSDVKYITYSSGSLYPDGVEFNERQMYQVPIFENGRFKEFAIGYYLYRNNYATLFIFKDFHLYDDSGDARMKGIFNIARITEISPTGSTRHPNFSTDLSNVPNQTPQNLDNFYYSIE